MILTKNNLKEYVLTVSQNEREPDQDCNKFMEEEEIMEIKKY